MYTETGGRRQVRQAVHLRFDDDHPVFPHPHRVRVDRDVRRQGQRAARLDVEARAVTRADDDSLTAVEVALTERPVVMRAPVLECEELAVAVVDPDGEERPHLDDSHSARRKLHQRTDIDLGHSYPTKISPLEVPHSSGSGVPLDLLRATLSTPSPSSAHLRRTGVSGMPISSSSSSLGIDATSCAVRPTTISVSIDVAAWLIAHPRPSKPTLSITSSGPNRTETVTSSPQSGFCPSATASCGSSTPWFLGVL